MGAPIRKINTCWGLIGVPGFGKLPFQLKVLTAMKILVTPTPKNKDPLRGKLPFEDLPLRREFWQPQPPTLGPHDYHMMAIAS